MDDARIVRVALVSLSLIVAFGAIPCGAEGGRLALSRAYEHEIRESFDWDADMIEGNCMTVLGGERGFSLPIGAAEWTLDQGFSAEPYHDPGLSVRVYDGTLRIEGVTSPELTRLLREECWTAFRTGVRSGEFVRLTDDFEVVVVVDIRELTGRFRIQLLPTAWNRVRSSWVDITVACARSGFQGSWWADLVDEDVYCSLVPDDRLVPWVIGNGDHTFALRYVRQTGDLSFRLDDTPVGTCTISPPADVDRLRLLINVETTPPEVGPLDVGISEVLIGWDE